MLTLRPRPPLSDTADFIDSADQVPENRKRAEDLLDEAEALLAGQPEGNQNRWLFGEYSVAEDTPNPVEHEQFSTDLFGCFEDHETLCIGLLAPCVLHAQNKERLEGQGHFLPACCAFAWLYGFSHIVLRGGCNVASLLSFQNRRK